MWHHLSYLQTNVEFKIEFELTYNGPVFVVLGDARNWPGLCPGDDHQHRDA